VAGDGVTRMARVRITLPREILERIDALVGTHGRSRFLEDASREKLDNDLDAALRATAGIAHGRAYRHWRDQRSITDWVRRSRDRSAPIS
jgi:hypothetical protein